MGHLLAAVICGGVFLVYGLFCLAVGWRNLGGAIPLTVVVFALGWLWRKIAVARPDKQQSSIR